MKTVMCLLDPDGSAVVYATSDVPRSFRRHRGVPVAGVECDPAVFRRVTGVGSLPARVPLSAAAGVFGRVPLSGGVRAAIVARLDKLGPSVSPVLLEWQRAVAA